MALYCQNRVSKGTNRRYGLHSSASISVHSALVTVLGLMKKKKKNWYQVSYLKHGSDRSGHASVCCLATYFDSNPSIAEFEPFYASCNTLIEAAILFPGHS